MIHSLISFFSFLCIILFYTCREGTSVSVFVFWKEWKHLRHARVLLEKSRRSEWKNDLKNQWESESKQEAMGKKSLGRKRYTPLLSWYTQLYGRMLDISRIPCPPMSSHGREEKESGRKLYEPSSIHCIIDIERHFDKDGKGHKSLFFLLIRISPVDRWRWKRITGHEILSRGTNR